MRWAGFLSLLDFSFVWISFFVGIWIRFDVFSIPKLAGYAPAVLLASLALPAILYIGGLYSVRTSTTGLPLQVRWLILGIVGVILSILVVGSLDFSARVGRGVMFWSLPILLILVSLRHGACVRKSKERYHTYLCMVCDAADEKIVEMLFSFWGKQAKRFGIVRSSSYLPESTIPCMGTIEEITNGRSSQRLDAILVRDRHFADPDVARFFRRLRYHGVDIIPLSDACEDTFHVVPIEIISDAWLFRASNQSQLFYVRKLKRLSDILFSFLFLFLLAPFFAIGCLLVKCASPGPLIFRQVRAGRFGNAITVLKLRTMHVAKGKEEGKWATAEEARLFPVGRILRQFRVDEIPQLINVLRGEMSFVGPRPEQMVLIEELAKEIPFYRERLLIQPGITGWAQVNYPYGASIEDAARKLEYDLYYMKHMGLFFDFFILLETVKTILSGGVRRGGDTDYLKFRKQLAGSGDVNDLEIPKTLASAEGNSR